MTDFDSKVIEADILDRMKKKNQSGFVSTLKVLYYLSPFGFLFNRREHDITKATIGELYNRELLKRSA